jgi:hypothetical protein
MLTPSQQRWQQQAAGQSSRKDWCRSRQQLWQSWSST